MLKNICLLQLIVGLVLASTSFGISQGSENVVLLDNYDDPSVFFNNGGAKYNDVWGFAHNGSEYAVIGSTKGTHFIQITEEDELIFRDFVIGGEISMQVVHRDYHGYQNYVYAICQQGENTSTLQVIDISYLPDSVHTVYDDDTLFSVAHNVFVDTATAKLYVCGPAGHAMSVYSLENPEEPVLLSHFDKVDYVHDAYVRNDTAFLNCAGDGLFVYDFSNTQNPPLMGSLELYVDKGYNHSGWLSPDGNTYVFADETEGKRLKVCDVSDITDIDVLSTFEAESPEVVETHLAHNLMYKDGFVYVSYYNDGLRIFDVRDRENPEQVGYYDTYPETHPSNFRGAWGVYAFLPSGKILISDRQTGLYLFQFIPPPDINSPLTHGVFPNPFDENAVFSFHNPNELVYDLIVYDSRGREVQTYTTVTNDYIRMHRAGLMAGMYHYELRGIDNTNQFFGKFVIY